MQKNDVRHTKEGEKKWGRFVQQEKGGGREEKSAMMGFGVVGGSERREQEREGKGKEKRSKGKKKRYRKQGEKEGSQEEKERERNGNQGNNKDNGRIQVRLAKKNKRGEEATKVKLQTKRNKKNIIKK